MAYAICFLEAPEIWKDHGVADSRGIRADFDPTRDRLVLAIGERAELRRWLLAHGLDEMVFPIETSNAVGWHIDLSNEALRVAVELGMFEDSMLTPFREWLKQSRGKFE